MILPFELRNPAGARGMHRRLIYRLGRRLVRENSSRSDCRLRSSTSEAASWWTRPPALHSRHPGAAATLRDALVVRRCRGARTGEEVDVHRLWPRTGAQRRLPFEETEKLSRLSGVMDAINRRTGDLDRSRSAQRSATSRKLDSKIASPRAEHRRRTRRKTEAGHKKRIG
jgi:hypothetical protein